MSNSTRRTHLPVLALATLLAGAPAQAETLANLEAVDRNGFSSWAGTPPFSIIGVVLNDPSEMLDPAAQFVPWTDGAGLFQLGGQWQVFVQAMMPGDRGGVECWMGQNYGNLPWLYNSDLSYSLGDAPTNRFDATGIFLQESGSGTDGTFGYELFVQETVPAVEPELNISMKAVITWPGVLASRGLDRRDHRRGYAAMVGRAR